MEIKEPKENSKIPNPCPSVKKIEYENDAHLKKYIMWENKSNICWLDASMALVAHNKVMKRYSGVSPECRISKIISAYDEAITILNSSDKNINQKINLARGKLNYVQESTLQYLQPILKYKTGDPESAFCSLYNLLIQDSVVKRIFDVTWIPVKVCTDCGDKPGSTKSKPIVTISKIDSFDPENPVVVYHCACNRSEQKIKLLYVSLPPCLIFHFESGAGKDKPPLSFVTRKRQYHLTGIMTLEKSQDSTVNHFITWVRSPHVNKWLDCNDLNLDIISFSPDFPDINLVDVYMYVYESFDDLGTITDGTVEKPKKSLENIPCIDLSEDSDTENNSSQCIATESNKDTGKMETSKSDLKSSSDDVPFSESDREKSLFKPISTDNENTLNKNIQHSDIDKNFKNVSNTTHANNDKKQIKPTGVDKKKVSNKNIKTNNSDILRTASFAVNKNLTCVNSVKEINENICKSDCSENKVTIAETNSSLSDGNNTKEINENICKSDCSENNVKITERNSSLTDGNNAKEINDNICKSDHSENNVKITETNSGDSSSFSSKKRTLKDSKVSSITEDTQENFKVKCRTSAKKELHNEEKQNFLLNTNENTQNKQLSSKSSICSNTIDEKPGKPKCLKNAKIRDLIQIKNNDKTNMKEENISNSEQLSKSSNAGQSKNKRLILNSETEQEIRSGHFLSDAATNSSGTSYVKVSVRRKKFTSHPLYKNCGNDNNPGEIFHNRAIDIPSSSKSLKRSRVVKEEIDEDWDYVSSEMPEKKKRLNKLSKVKRGEIITEEKRHNSKALKVGLKKKSPLKSKMNSIAGKRARHDNSSGLNALKQERHSIDNRKLLSEQICFPSSAVSETVNSDNEGKILKDFEDVWSCHKSGCNCDCADLDETIDAVVDYTFAYICKLSQEFKKSSTQ